MRVSSVPPSRGSGSGRLARGVGIFGILTGAAICLGTFTGRIPAASGGNTALGYMVGGTTAAYGLLRFLRGNVDRDRSG